jgi:hypothetical protein
MPGIDETRAYLRISGDDVDPDAITAALGASPSYAFRKGDVYRQRVAKTGRWGSGGIADVERGALVGIGLQFQA